MLKVDKMIIEMNYEYSILIEEIKSYNTTLFSRIKFAFLKYLNILTKLLFHYYISLRNFTCNLVIK
jgi:hypothetical protein